MDAGPIHLILFHIPFGLEVEDGFDLVAVQDLHILNAFDVRAQEDMLVQLRDLEPFKIILLIDLDVA